MFQSSIFVIALDACGTTASCLRTNIYHIAAFLGLLGFSFPGESTAQAAPYDWEISPRIGVIQHELANHRATHVTFGFQFTPFRIGPVGIGAGVDGWTDRVSLGSVYGDRVVRANFFVYGLELDASAGKFLGSDIFLTAGAGAQTARFGERYEAAVIFPRYSNSPLASLGLGSRIPLIESESALLLRFEARGRAVYGEIFDALGVEEGREWMFIPALSVGLSYAGH